MSTASTRGEVLALYREILRTARVFRAANAEQARAVMQSARREFEENRNLSSREDIIRCIVVARAALHDVQQRVRLRSFHSEASKSNNSINRFCNKYL